MAIVAIVIVGLLRMAPAIDSTPFQRDEARWVGNSAILREWRHPFGEKWQDEGYSNRYGTVDESNRRRSQPPLAMYVLGIGLLVQGQHLPDSGYWIMTQDADWNIAHGNMPSPGQLRAARFTNMTLALATAVMIMIIGRAVFGGLGGLLSGLGYVLHPLVLSTSTRAWSDPTLVFCLSLAGAAAINFGRRPSLVRAGLIGIALGFGAAAKLSPLVLALLVAPFIAAPLVPKNSSPSRRRTAVWLVTAVAVVPATAFAAFVALYPYLWIEPIGHTRRMFDFRANSFTWQGDAFTDARVVDFPDGLRRIGVQMSDRFSLGQYIASLMHTEFDFPRSYWAGELDLTLAVAGCLLLVAWLTAARWPVERMAPLVVLAGQTVLIAATYHLDYSRYLLPAVPMLVIGIAASISLPMQYIMRLMSPPGHLGQRHDPKAESDLPGSSQMNSDQLSRTIVPSSSAPSGTSDTMTFG